jgi:hypothetical protein
VSARDDGGPAFPLTQPAAVFEATQCHEDGSITEAGWRPNAPISGMTLRDYFAAKVIQAVMTSAQGVGLLPDDERHAAWFAASRVSYEIADAMLKARAAS